MPNGDMTPMTDDEIQDFMVALLKPEELKDLVDGRGFPPAEELLRRSYGKGPIREMLVRVFGEEAVAEHERRSE